MGFEPLGKTIKSLLSDHTEFKIPRFQRDFSWEKRHYDEFFNDIISQLIYTENAFKTDKYFLGNMILLGSKNDESIDVIDGQQRLTTITIFLAAIRNRLSSLDNHKAKDIADTIQNEYILKKMDGEIYRRLMPKSSFPYFANTIQDTNITDESLSEEQPTTDEEKVIEQTFEFFLEVLSYDNLKKVFFTKFKLDIDDDLYIDSLKIIRDQILNCEVVSIYADDKLQANRIFENINSKGKPLTQVDLIKNYIFNSISESSVGVDNLEITWKGMKEKLSVASDENTNFSISFDEFFMDYLKAKYPALKITSRNVYEKFRKQFPGKAKPEEFVKDIKSDIDTYTDVINPILSKFSQQHKKPTFYALQSINRFKGRQVRIPILALFLKKKQNNALIKNEDLTDIMQFLANFHFAAFGSGLKIAGNQTTKPFSDFTKALADSKNKNDTRKAIDRLKESLLERIVKDDFIEHFCQLTYDKKKAGDEGFSEFPASFAIHTIENSLSKSRVNHEDGSIEHILDESDTQIRNIGNLISLERKINDDIEKAKKKNNGKMLEYAEKLPYYKKSRYPMVKKLIDEYDTFFDRKNVSERAKNLAEYFYEEVLTS